MWKNLSFRSLVFRVLSLIIVLGACVWILRSLELGRFWEALHTADWRWLLLASLLNLVLNSAARSLRFLVLLSSLESKHPRPSFGRITQILLATRALNLILPAKTGETLRALQLHRGYGYSLKSLVAILLFEPFIEALSLGIPCVFLLSFLHLPASLVPQFYLMGAVGVIGLVSLIFLWSAPSGNPCPPVSQLAPSLRFKQIYRKWIGAFQKLKSREIWGKALLWSWVSDLVDLATIGLCLSAVSVSLSPLSWFVVLIAVNVAIAIPMTPGAIGQLEAGAVLALNSMGVDADKALAFAIFYRAVHAIPIGLIGWMSLHFQWNDKLLDFSFRRNNDTDCVEKIQKRV